MAYSFSSRRLVTGNSFIKSSVLFWVFKEGEGAAVDDSCVYKDEIKFLSAFFRDSLDIIIS